MGRDMAEETKMSTRAFQRLVREGDFVAEVDVQLIEADGGWAPYLSLADAYRLDDVREALRSGDLKRASQLASRVYRLTAVTA
jgi:Asp-tRNA(Asn)/Glu-tRNA(Gln) amidotransferase A subunit family amidase